MKKPIDYTIIFNGEPDGSTPLTYKYGNLKNNIEVYVGEQQAKLHFSTGTKKKNVEDFITFKYKLFRDAYRKILMIHALKYNCGLTVKSIEIRIDDETWMFDESSQHFPFMFSMIRETDLGLNKDWKNLVEPVLEVPKSKKDTDLRFCAVFSFLASKNREYSIDRFTNLWTAMNAYGNQLAKAYEAALCEEFVRDDISKTKWGAISLYGQDGKIVNTLGLLLKNPLTLHSAAETNALWKDYYGVQDALANVAVAEYPNLYEEAWNALVNGSELPEKYADLKKCEEHFDRPLFILLLLDYPYYMRCKYLHGSLSTLLFAAYNDYELASLGCVNYFIERFLNERIPLVFTKEFYSDEWYRKMKECIKTLSGEKVFEKLNTHKHSPSGVS